MQTMYDIIAKELKAMRLNDVHPQDYLNFYCLGNRENIPEEMSREENQSSPSSKTVIVRSEIFV